MKFAVIGGDLRFAEACALLEQQGHEVFPFALELAEGLTCCQTLEVALHGADCVLLPLPVCAQRGLLNAPLSAGEYAIDDVFAAIEPRSLVAAGKVDSRTRAAAERYGLNMVDYLNREELAIYNAAATAEGAIALIMQNTAITLWRSRVLITGFGRIGKLLAHKLSALGAYVTVSSRSFEDKAWCEVLGYEVMDTRELCGLGRFDVVVNTVPANVLGEQELLQLRPDTLCMDLASRPGGVDFAAAARCGIRALWALSLPGEASPHSAAGMILDTIGNITAERSQI